MASGAIIVTKDEQYRHALLMDFVSGKLKRNEVARLLGFQERSITRLCARVRIKGIAGVKHGNSGRKPVNSLDASFKKRVIALMRSDYFDLNLTHALEKLASEHGLSPKRETFRKWCQEVGLVKRRHKRRSHARIYRERMPHEGMLLQMDGSPHRWNGKDVWTLISTIDDATSDIPYAEFFPSEDTAGCMQVLWRIIERRGLPEALYVDRAGIFGGGKRQHFSHFARACEELGIRVLFAYSPQAKGRVERSFQTLQDRLVPELRMRNIHRMDKANAFLRDEYLPNFWNQRFRKPARDPLLRYRPLPPSVCLREIFCFKQWRTIASDQTISLDGKRRLIGLPTPYSLRGQRVEIRDYIDGSRQILFAGRPVEILDLEDSIGIEKLRRKAG